MTLLVGFQRQLGAPGAVPLVQPESFNVFLQGQADRNVTFMHMGIRKTQ
jgi:hypothetical protein